MELLAMYSDGDRSDSTEQNSDVGEKDVSPPRVQPSFTPDLQAEWESFEKLISAGHEGVKPVHQQYVLLDGQDVTGVSEAKEAATTLNRCVDSAAVKGDGAIGTSEKPADYVALRIRVGSTSGTQSPWSASSNPESDSLTEVKKQPEEEIKVSSRTPSKSPEAHSRSMSPADDKGAEKAIRRCRSRSSTPGHSSRSRSGSDSAQSRSSSRERSRTRKSRSQSRSRSRSKSRSPYRSARSSRHRRRKHSYRSKSRSHSRSRRYRRSRPRDDWNRCAQVLQPNCCKSIEIR
ncbi:pre-mRNA-splicing factor CWC22 homolog [Octopus bimaculoides]|nr:pre-mRNA-splicing factor CWC22 homolog [Octopus bimaculoides]|eukprot:XP_014786289.1 PREDICTED: pre-mRNA-splicing factor CWC22 homolog [Octopus bimaculoides]